ncbi:MAG: 3'-phosphoesterase [Desulfobacterales bacterium]|nr:3'-phosphoesterase [Desulfobacterales bacterium]MBF0396491.1 3'-phosphoesterase [Desulfobacterales bacterium]
MKLEAGSQNLLQRFVVHEHFSEGTAGHHYDIRLEYEGVLKSWASRYLDKLITGEKEKVLLIQTPDHELEYFNFEGRIEDGYGRGEVKIWDTGLYEAVKWEDKSKLIYFKGKKLDKIFVILNTKGNQYLMFKKKE